MNQIRLSTVLAIAAWASLLALTWLLALGPVSLSSLTAAVWIFFMFVAVGASAVGSPRRSDDE
jgi:hypothetical protein